MNLRWRMKIFKDWTFFLWDRFPTMLRTEIEYRIYVLVGFRRFDGAWNLAMMPFRLSQLQENFADYMAVLRERHLREMNPDCWGGDMWEDE